MIKKKDYELIAEAYARIETINECWEKMSAPQKSKVESILKSKSGYKIGDHAYSDEKKTVTLTHELGSDAERDIIVDDKGEEVVHIHNESVDPIDPNEFAKCVEDARRNFDSPKAHGRLAGAQHRRGKAEGIVPSNPHTKGSPAAQDWQDGFDEIMAMDDKAGKKEVEDGKVHTAPVTGTPSDVKESVEAIEEKKKMACGKGCECEKCPECMPKKKSLAKALEEAYDAVIEEAKKKLSPAQKKIAAAAPPPDEITGADFKALKKKKHLKENTETWGVEGKLRDALQEVEGVGYTGDGLDPKQVATLVAGSQADWGDDYGPLIQALTHVIEAYYGRGLQDS